MNEVMKDINDQYYTFLIENDNSFHYDQKLVPEIEN